NLTLDAGTSTGTTGTISLGVSNASAITIGRTGVAVSMPGGLTTSNGNANFGSGTITSGNITSGTVNSQTISSTASFTGTLNVATGFKVNGAATSGNYLRGDGTNFVSSAIQAADI